MEKLEKLISIIENKANEYVNKLNDLKCDEHLIKLFKNCYMNTIETTVSDLTDDETFLITGDIDAMWLRDSSAQVIHYLDLAKDNKDIRDFIKGLINKQFKCINIDTYANAFNKVPLVSQWRTDKTEMNDYEWERKYELDSLCYPINLLFDYYKITNDKSVFTKNVYDGLLKAIDTMQIEQHHETDSKYRFVRERKNRPTVLINDGLGSHSTYTGMIYSCFRASDDVATYGYNIPENFFAAKALNNIVTIAKEIYDDEVLANKASKLKGEVLEGISKYGTIENETHGTILAYEVDGLGNQLFMDDANVPSLLSLPFIGIFDKDDELYLATRKAILSNLNPYYFKGQYAKGIGSPHTRNSNIWPMSLIIQGLTSTSNKEKEELINTLVNTDAGLYFMHESFNPDNPNEFSRPWFAWANSLFAMLVIDYYNLDK